MHFRTPPVRLAPDAPRAGRIRRLLLLVVAACALTLALGATSAFAKDASGNLDQCANGPITAITSCDGAQWQNGNLNGNQAHYFEGDSVPYRLRFQDLVQGQSYTVQLEWDTTKSGKHALDYLTSYDRTETTGAPDPSQYHANLSDPCGDYLTVAECATPTSPLTPSAADIPVDATMVSRPDWAGTQTSSPGKFTMWGGAIGSVSAQSYSGSWAGDSSATIYVTFTATTSSGNAVLAWAGHIATRQDWGVGNSAITIPGSPYHMRLMNLTPPDRGGNQDRSLSADAVVYPAYVTITKSTPSPTTTAFDYAAGGTGFSFPFPLTTDSASAFKLDTGTGGYTASLTSNPIVDFGTSRSVTESQPNSLWSLDSVSCSITHGIDNTGTAAQDGSDPLKTNFNLVEGDLASCTYNNKFTRATPTLATQGSNRVTEQTVGGTITDTATVSGGFSPTGTVTFKVFAPGDTTCATPLNWGDGTFSKTVTLSSGSATSPAFTTSAVGTYRWIAKYDGDANNTAVEGSCNDTDEFSLTKRATPTLATQGSNRVTEQTVGGTITDTATVSGGYSPTGTVTFSVYAPGDTTCATALDWGDGDTSKTVALASGSATSPAFTTAAVGTYRWVASYSGDPSNNSVSGACNDTDEFSKTKQATPVLATEGSNRVTEQTIGGTITDTAHVTGGFSPTGSVTFSVYAPGDTTCATALDWGDGDTSKTVALASGDATSPAFTTSAVGTYRWIASYSGDNNNNSVSGACGDDDEFSITKKDSPSISTQVSSAKIGLGHSVQDVATVSGGYSPTGAVTFNVYGPVDANDAEPSCIDEGPNANLVATLAGSALANGTSTSASFTPQQVGRYLFVAHYAGDANNNPASGACNDASERVDVVAVSVSVTKDPNETHAYDGDKVSFTIAAKNVGTDSLANVKVVDHIQGTSHGCETLSAPSGDTDGDDQLDPGETWKWICTVTVEHGEENAQHLIVNLAKIEGDVVTTGDNTPAPSDHVVSNEDDASVPVYHPAIAVDKTGPATAEAGQKVGYVLTVTNPGDIGFAEATVTLADQECDGDPVTLLGKGGDASPTSLDPGDTWTYSCSVQTALGENAVHNVATVTGCDRFDKCVNDSDDADTTLTQPVQLLLPERITPGTARLLGPTGCAAKAFNARVRGSKIATVTITLDGKVKKRIRNRKNAKVISYRINPAKMKVGVHRLVVNVTFQAGSGTKPKTMRLSFQRCAKKLRTPRFTG